MSIDFEALFALSPNPYIVVDRNLDIAWLNDAYSRATMRSREELTGLGIFEAFPSEPGSESHEMLRTSFERVLETACADELAFVRYDIPRADGGMERRYWSATHTPLFGSDGQVAHILQHTVDVTELHGLRQLRDEKHVVERARAVQARNRDLAAESQRLKTMYDQAPGFIAIVDGPDHVFTIANNAYRQLTAGRPIIGKTVAEGLPEVVEQGFVDLLDEVYRTGIPYIGRGSRVSLESERTGRFEDRYLDFIYQPILDERGSVVQIFVQGQDVTEQFEAVERQQLLIDELNHRVKNTLAIVQSLATQSFRDPKSFADARLVFEGRLQALAVAHDLLTERSWQPAELSVTVRGTVAAAVGSAIDRVRIDGPSVLLVPHASVSMALAMHELATNAVKYGALSSVSGEIAINWRILDEENGRRLVIDWLESGGPMVSPPVRRGFGTRLIERSFAADKGQSSMEFDPKGLRCRFSLMLPQEPEVGGNN